MGTIQHHLVSLFKDKKFDKKFFKEFLLDQVDYNMYKKGNILNLIEAYVFKKTLMSLCNRRSFVALNHESELLNESGSIYGYSREKSQQKAGQMHVDWVGVNAFFTEKGEIQLIVSYNDVKMYESNACMGRITLKPELIHNKGYIREYLSKVVTGLRTEIMKKNLEGDNNFSKLLTKLEKKEKDILLFISKETSDKSGNFASQATVQQVSLGLDLFNQIILDAMAEPTINEHINLGLSVDPGRCEQSILFDKSYIIPMAEADMENMSEEQFEALHRTQITPENERLVKGIEHSWRARAPKELLEGSQQVTEFINAN